MIFKLKIIVLLSIGVFLALTLSEISATRAEIQTKNKNYKYQCVIFDHKNNQVVLQGHLNAASFQEMFKQGYSVGGERMETPIDATPFGALVLTNGSEIMTMPLYKWSHQGSWKYFCQSRSIGTPPRFSVFGDSQQKFFKQMSLELNKR